MNDDDIVGLTDASPGSGVSPFELLMVLWRRRLIVVVVLIVALVVSVGLSLRAQKQYASSAQLLFREPSFAQALFGSNLFQTEQEEPQRTTQTDIDVVSSLSVAEEARSLLHTRVPAATLLGAITVSPSSNADIATIKAKASTPKEAADIANAFAEGYIVYRRDTDRNLVGQAEALVGKSLAVASLAARPKLETSLHQLAVLKSLQTGNAELIAGARPEDTPVEPRPKRGALVGGLIGLLLGCGLALLVDRLDQRLKTLDDVERAYEGYPVIASIPRSSTRSPKEPYSPDPGAEAYRMLREGLRFLDPKGMAHCFVVTSAEEGEGKTTVAVNLASALAAIGQRVVLLEADMRRPTVADKLGLHRNAPGLSDVLASGADLESCLATPQEPNLAILSSGWIPPNPADLLRATEMTEVISMLRESADIVIIDSPPLLPVADTRVLLQIPMIDGVILVSRVERSRRDRARTARQVLIQSGRRVFGLVITDVPGSLRSGYGNYGTSPTAAPDAVRSARRTRQAMPRSASRAKGSVQK